MTQEATIHSLSDDLMIGADAIAQFMFGDPGARRKVYHLVKTDQIPTFKMGDSICARRSKVLECIEAREAAAAKGKIDERCR